MAASYPMPVCAAPTGVFDFTVPNIAPQLTTGSFSSTSLTTSSTFSVPTPTSASSAPLNATIPRSISRSVAQSSNSTASATHVPTRDPRTRPGAKVTSWKTAYATHNSTHQSRTGPGDQSTTRPPPQSRQGTVAPMALTASGPQHAGAVTPLPVAGSSTLAPAGGASDALAVPGTRQVKRPTKATKPRQKAANTQPAVSSSLSSELINAPPMPSASSGSQGLAVAHLLPMAGPSMMAPMGGQSTERQPAVPVKKPRKPRAKKALTVREEAVEPQPILQPSASTQFIPYMVPNNYPTGADGQARAAGKRKASEIEELPQSGPFVRHPRVSALAKKRKVVESHEPQLSTAADLGKNPPTIFYIPKDTKQCPGCGDWFPSYMVPNEVMDKMHCMTMPPVMEATGRLFMKIQTQIPPEYLGKVRIAYGREAKMYFHIHIGKDLPHYVAVEETEKVSFIITKGLERLAPLDAVCFTEAEIQKLNETVHALLRRDPLPLQRQTHSPPEDISGDPVVPISSTGLDAMGNDVQQLQQQSQDLPAQTDVWQSQDPGGPMVPMVSAGTDAMGNDVWHPQQDPQDLPTQEDVWQQQQDLPSQDDVWQPQPQPQDLDARSWIHSSRPIIPVTAPDVTEPFAFENPQGHLQAIHPEATPQSEASQQSQEAIDIFDPAQQHSNGMPDYFQEFIQITNDSSGLFQQDEMFDGLLPQEWLVNQNSSQNVLHNPMWQHDASVMPPQQNLTMGHFQGSEVQPQWDPTVFDSFAVDPNVHFGLDMTAAPNASGWDGRQW